MRIQKNIPIPPKGSHVVRRSKYERLSKAEVGDSILVKNTGKATYVYKLMKEKGGGVTSRKVENGIRIWRTS